MVIFEDVFIPWEQVYLYGEYESAGIWCVTSAITTAIPTGVQGGVGDILIGRGATAADYNGLPNVSHINNKLAEMLKVTEAIYGCSIALRWKPHRLRRGFTIVDPVLSNTSKLYEGKELAEVIRMMIEIAAVWWQMFPSDKDFANPRSDHC